MARPLPLYHLTVDLTTTTPLNPQPLFSGGKGHFPIENREIQVKVPGVPWPLMVYLIYHFCLFQDFSVLSRYLSEQHGIHFLNYMSDFHLLYFLYTANPAAIDFKVCQPCTDATSLIPGPFPLTKGSGNEAKSP